LPSFKETWDTYSATYDTDGGARTLVVRLPGHHEISGPAGTLTGLHDLAEKVLAAVARGVEERIDGSYRWPPQGYFLSQTRRLRQDGSLSEYLDKDWSNPEEVWSADMIWTPVGRDNSLDASVGVRHWRHMADALRRLMAVQEIRELEEAAAIPV
jgi:hypothetical protein